jgi:hypothetical protein
VIAVRGPTWTDVEHLANFLQQNSKRTVARGLIGTHWEPFFFASIEGS